MTSKKEEDKFNILYMSAKQNPCQTTCYQRDMKDIHK